MTMEDLSLVEEHPEFSFPDGNLVFLAGKNPAIAFRLHRDSVYRWSHGFRELLDVRDAATDHYTFKGQPAIKLSDSALDFDRFVRAMYHGAASLPTKCTVKDFPHLASILVLSQKYNVTHLFDRARVILLAAYPFTLSVWDVREAYESTPAIGYSRIEAVRSHAPPLGVVSLALQLDAPCLLVPAYLDLARLPASEIIRGYTTTTPIANAPAGVTLQLNPKQTTSVLRGKETLQRFIAEFIRTEVEQRAPAAQCRYSHVGVGPGPTSCSEAFAQVAHEMLMMTADVVGGVDSDPLFVLHFAVQVLKLEDGSRGGGACTACGEGFRLTVRMARQYVWGCLENWFDLRKLVDQGFNEGGWD